LDFKNHIPNEVYLIPSSILPDLVAYPFASQLVILHIQPALLSGILSFPIPEETGFAKYAKCFPGMGSSKSGGNR